MKIRLRFLVTILVILIIFLIYSRSNSNSNLLNKANNYYNAKNYSQAQKYYEKAFASNISDSVSRKNYVNMILNSPTTLESLEKLAVIANSSIDDSAKDNAEDYLYKLRREIYDKYPDNYASQALFNHKVLRWGELPIKYGFVFEVETPDYYKTEIMQAFTQWENMTSGAVTFKRDDSNPDIVIKFTNNFETKFEEGKMYVLAYTVPMINFSKLEQMVITFYPRNFDGEYYTESQIYNTALHEIEHALGVMGHSSSRKNILYISKDPESYKEDKKRNLSTADINTIKLLYNTKPDITNVQPKSSEYIPYLIAGGEDDIFYTKSKEARNYILNAPNLPNGYIDMASNYVNSNEYNKAIRYLKKAYELSVEIEQKDIVNYNLAVVYYKNNNYDMALKSLDRIQKVKNVDEYNSFKAEIYLQQGNIDKAIEIYKDLVKKNPQNIEFTIALTNIYITEKEYFKARGVLKEFFRNNPEEKINPRFDNYGIIRLFL